MCTLSWLATANGYELLFNRDEARTRLPATAPTPRLIDGVEVLAPTDGDFGGTWISLNTFGTCIALLNRYQDRAVAAGPFTSRGQLVLDLATCLDLASVEQRLAQRRLEDYRPFTLAVTVPGDGSAASHACAWQIVWNGRRRQSPEAVQPPIASSGHCPATIQGERRQLFAAMRAEGAPLLDIHRSHRPSRGPVSPCMHRPDASTVSLIRIVVDAERVAMAYADGPPCRTPLGGPLELRRRSSEAAVHG